MIARRRSSYRGTGATRLHPRLAIVSPLLTLIFLTAPTAQLCGAPAVLRDRFGLPVTFSYGVHRARHLLRFVAFDTAVSV